MTQEIFFTGLVVAFYGCLVLISADKLADGSTDDGAAFCLGVVGVLMIIVGLAMTFYSCIAGIWGF